MDRVAGGCIVSKKVERRECGSFTLLEVSEMTGVDQSALILFIQREWICPAAVDELDEEDIARTRLVHDLRVKFGANDDSIPLILHLLDQLYYLRNQMRQSLRSR